MQAGGESDCVLEGSRGKHVALFSRERETLQSAKPQRYTHQLVKVCVYSVFRGRLEALKHTGLLILNLLSQH